MAKKTRAELSTEAVTTNLPDNNQELITPATERTQLASERESTLNYKDDITGTVGQALVVGADGESIEFEDLATGNVTTSGTSTSNRVAVWLSGTELQTTSPISVVAQQLILLAQTASSHNIGGGNLYKPPNEGGTRVTGINNTGFGYLNLNNVLAGTRNIALGYNSGSAITSGSNNVVIGSDPGTSIATLSNRIIISDGAGNVRQTFDDSGDATFSGALSGTSATFSTGLIVSNIADVYPEIKTSAADADAFLGFSNTADGNNAWSIGRRNTGEFWISNYTGDFNSGTRTQPLIIESTGAATFTGDVTSGGASQNLFIANGNTYSGLKLQRGGADKWAIFNNNAGTDFLDFYWYGSSPGTKFKIEPTGAATFSGQINANNGISFPNQSAGSGTVSSSILNAYEEGTWTPTATNATGTGTYTRIGRLVTVQASIDWSGVGAISINGLPFTTSAAVNAGSIRYGYIDLPTNTVQMVVLNDISSTYITGYTMYDNGGVVANPATQNASYAIISLQYTI